MLRASTARSGNGSSALEKGHRVLAWEVPVADSAWGLGDHWGNVTIIALFLPVPGQLLLTSVVGRCELAVAVPVGTGHWQVAVPCLESRAAAGAAGRFLHTLVL